MTEDAFRAFYERTAPGVWAYLVRTTGDRAQADDLLQEACYRMLRSGRDYEDDEHRRHALYTIATNLVRDSWRRRKHNPEAGAARLLDDIADDRTDADGRSVAQADLKRTLARLSVRDHQLLLLAYARGWSHKEISRGLGLTVASVKLLLWRARKRAVALLAPVSSDKASR